MKLHVRKAAEPTIRRTDTIVFKHGPHRVDVATATAGNFDSTPYEPRHDAWSYTAELHEHAGRLWVVVVEAEETVTLEDGKWVHREDEEQALYVSADEGKTWQSTAERPPLDEATRRDRVVSTR